MKSLVREPSYICFRFCLFYNPVRKASLNLKNLVTFFIKVVQLKEK